MKKTKAKISLAIGAVLCSCFAIATQNAFADMSTEKAAVESVIDSLTSTYQTMISTHNAGNPDKQLKLVSSQDCVPLPTGTGIMQTYSLGSVDISKVCNNSFVTLKDSRDNTTYTVAKLADGNVWMLDNLALNLVTHKDNLNSTNTNASNTSLGYLKGTQTRDPEDDPDGNYATAGVSTNWNDSYSYSAPLINTDYLNTVGETNQQWGNGSHKYGIYYNYCATSAGSYCYGNGTETGTPSGNATEDICPASWRLPTGGETGEFRNLCNLSLDGTCLSENQPMTASNQNSLQYLLSAPLSGRIPLMYQGEYAVFWSSTNDGGARMYRLRLSNEYADAYQSGVGANRYFGASIRCVLKSTAPTEEEPTSSVGPYYKPDSIDAYLTLNRALTLTITTTDDVIASVLEPTPVVEKLTSLGFTKYSRPYFFPETNQYINETTGVLCAVRSYGTTCGHINWQDVSDKWGTFADGIGKAFYKSEEDYPFIMGDVSSDNTPTIYDSDYEPYQYTVVGMDDYVGLFYRKSPTSEWIYFKGTQGMLTCDEYSGETEKGFAGVECYNAETKTVERVGALLVPDTGFFTGEMDGTKAIIYAGSAILGTGTLYLVIYSVKRSAHRNRFRK